MKGLLLTFNLLCAGDALSTHYALHTGRAYEAVLPTQNPWAVDAIVAAEAVSVTGSTLTLRKNHPKLAWTLLIAGTALRSYAVVNNLRALQ